MKVVKELRRGASGYAEFDDTGRTFYFPAALAGAVLSIVVTEKPPDASAHTITGALARDSRFAVLESSGAKFYFPLSMVGRYAAIDVIAPVTGTPQTTPSTTTSTPSTTSSVSQSAEPEKGLAAAARAALQVLAPGAATTAATTKPTDAKARHDPSDVHPATGRVRQHNDEDLEVLG